MKKASRRTTRKDTLRREYDFSGGVRGKHHQAMESGYTITVHRRNGSTVIKEIPPQESATTLEKGLRIPWKAYWIAATALLSVALVVMVVYLSTRSAQAEITLTSIADVGSIRSQLATLATNLDQIIAVDYQETSDSVIVSVHSTSGTPNNFVRISRTGVVTQFSIASGFPEEVYLAVAPSQNSSRTGLSMGGFNVGDVFAGSGFGTGSGATIARISADGTTVQNPFATLPGETGLCWGGLYFDRTGNFGGDLMVCTTTGGVYRVKSTGGAATLIARDRQNRVFKHIITLPNDSRFGPLSGKILLGGTDTGLPASGETNLFTVDPMDANPMGVFTAYSLPDVVKPEGFRIVPPGGDFFGTDFITQTIVTAPASQFSSLVGHLIIASAGEAERTDKTSKLFEVRWDTNKAKLQATEIIGGRVGQYKDIAFSWSGVSKPTVTRAPGMFDLFPMAICLDLSPSTRRRSFLP